MPNNLVFNRVASDLQVQIFGLYGTTVKAINVDTNGNMLVYGTVTVSGGSISVGSVTVSGGTIDTLTQGTVTVRGGTIDTLTQGTVTVQGGTIDTLTQGTVTVRGGTIDTLTQGTVTVQGGTIDTLTQGTVTVRGGTIQTVPVFTNTNTTIAVGTTTTQILDQDTSTQKVYSFYASNLSATYTVYAWLEIAPSDAPTYFVSDASGTFTLSPSGGTSSIAVLVAKQFLNYTRLRLVATDTASVLCYFNAQS